MSIVKNIGWLILICHTNIAAGQQEPIAQKAAQWLQAAVEGYFADSLTMQQIATARYADFKTDAMNMDMNGGMSQSAFEQKWGKLYPVHQPDLHEAFMIPLQDWDKVAATCNLLVANDTVVWAAVTIQATPHQQMFYRCIRVIKEGQNWLIDDIHAVQPLSRCITGDFNGDQRTDTLCASFSRRIDERPVLADTLMDYDLLIASVVAQKPLLQLTGKKLAELVLNKENDYVLGLDHLSNIGNVDQAPGDEIGLVVKAADWSNDNIYQVYSYRRPQWKRIKQIAIKEETLPAIRSGSKKPWLEKKRIDPL